MLNAKYHQQEAEIIERGGQPGAVTIATNMAGRGQDIKVDPSVLLESIDSDDGGPPDKGGLRIVGSERHDSRRIDRQLRGRSGRQGDPGASQFFISLEDDLMRLFNSERIASLMTRTGAEEGEVITHPIVTKALNSAQKRVETNHFEIRKRLLDYDDVMNQQREVIYDRRRYALEHENLHEEIGEMIQEVVDELVAEYASDEVDAEGWNLDALQLDVSRIFGVDAGLASAEELMVTEDDAEPVEPDALRDRILRAIDKKYQSRCDELRRRATSEGMDDENAFVSRLEKTSILSAIDERWRDHLTDIEDIKGGIHLRQYAQKDPVVEFKREAFDMFSAMIAEIDRHALESVFTAQLPSERVIEQRRAETERLRALHSEFEGERDVGDAPKTVGAEQQVRTPGGRGARKPIAGRRRTGKPKAGPVTVEKTVSRNAQCPCGSGKKYKYCHGAT